MRVALAQFDSKLMDIEFNNRKMAVMIKKAAQENADIIVFPELFTTGYNMDVIKDDILSISQDINGSTVTIATKEARNNSIHAIIPMAYRENDRIYNSAVIIDDKGNILDIYHKNHLWDTEKRHFSYGDDSYKVYETSFGKIGVIICYDVDFPETCRKLSLMGAQVIFVCAAWSEKYRSLWEIFLPARALENTVYVAGINRIGAEGNVTFFGGSKVYNPTGKIIAKTYNSEKILYCNLDTDKISEIRKEFPYLEDMRQKG